MTGVWLVSYVVLWVLFVAVCLLLVGVLRQIGVLHRQVGHRPTEVKPPSEPDEPALIPPLENDGPPVGSYLPRLTATTVNDFGSISLPADRGRGSTLLMFMSPLCDTCQQAVGPLNALARDQERAVQPIAIVKGDSQGCEAFLSVFPLQMPTVCDVDRRITMNFEVHRSPFALLYDAAGVLVRKGVITGYNDLKALLGDASVPVEAQTNVFPQPAAPTTAQVMA